MTTKTGGGAPPAGIVSTKDEHDMDRLADQLAEGRSLPLAATRCGISIFRAEFLLARIRQRLGSQAE